MGMAAIPKFVDIVVSNLMVDFVARYYPTVEHRQLEMIGAYARQRHVLGDVGTYPLRELPLKERAILWLYRHIPERYRKEGEELAKL